MKWSALEFRAMGTNCRVVAPDADAARHAAALVGELEQRWSRFLPDSEVSQLNRSPGRVCVVSELTFELVSRAEQARVATSGAFNPLMLDQLERLGYDRTWDRVERDRRDVIATQAASLEPIELFGDASAVRLPEGTRFDPGGIGKGLAGDLIAWTLRSEGAQSVQIELGGDVRVDGPAWGGGEWRVHVDDVDHGTAHAATIGLAAGGVATSSIVRRRWRRNAVELHHVLDPGTGTSADTDLDAVTAVAPNLWWAEVVAKVALAGGSSGARRTLEAFDMTGVLVAGGAQPSYEAVTQRSVAA
jgi:thiamine biosynthesis lipoprotein